MLASLISFISMGMRYQRLCPYSQAVSSIFSLAQIDRTWCPNSGKTICSPGSSVASKAPIYIASVDCIHRSEFEEHISCFIIYSHVTFCTVSDTHRSMKTVVLFSWTFCCSIIVCYSDGTEHPVAISL